MTTINEPLEKALRRSLDRMAKEREAIAKAQEQIAKSTDLDELFNASRDLQRAIARMRTQNKKFIEVARQLAGPEDIVKAQ